MSRTKLAVVCVVVIAATLLYVLGPGLMQSRLGTEVSPQETIYITANASRASPCPSGATPPCWLVGIRVYNLGIKDGFIEQIQLNGTRYMYAPGWAVVYFSDGTSHESNVSASSLAVPVRAGENILLQVNLDSSGAMIGGMRLASGQILVISLITKQGSTFLTELTLP